MLTALRRSRAVPPENDLAELVPGPAVDEEIIRRILYGISQLPEPVVLVLDDFHNIHDADVLSGVAMLLRYQLPQRRLVLITRMDPVFSLHRLRLSGEADGDPGSGSGIQSGGGNGDAGSAGRQR